ncbi:MAG TPA: DUF494 family protein [Firmicutes bacterium]|nr:DUF494 family protein [Bacillota bacterium]
MRKRTQERVLALIDYLEELCRSSETDLDMKQLYGNDRFYNDLLKLGFDSAEINMAFALILKGPEKLESGEERNGPVSKEGPSAAIHRQEQERPIPVEKNDTCQPQQTAGMTGKKKPSSSLTPSPTVYPRPVWIFSDQEQIKLSPQLRGELLRLYQDSYLTMEEMFAIVNCAMSMECGEIQVTDLAYIISRVIRESAKVETLLSNKELRMLS